MKTKKMHKELISDEDCLRNIEEEIDEQQEPGWQIVRRRKGRSKAGNGSDAAVSLRDSDSSMDFIHNHSWCGNNDRKKRQRMEDKMTNGRKSQGHQTEGGEN